MTEWHLHIQNLPSFLKLGWKTPQIFLPLKRVVILLANLHYEERFGRFGRMTLVMRSTEAIWWRFSSFAMWTILLTQINFWNVIRVMKVGIPRTCSKHHEDCVKSVCLCLCITTFVSARHSASICMYIMLLWFFKAPLPMITHKTRLPLCCQWCMHARSSTTSVCSNGCHRFDDLNSGGSGSWKGARLNVVKKLSSGGAMSPPQRKFLISNLKLLISTHCECHFCSILSYCTSQKTLLLATNGRGHSPASATGLTFVVLIDNKWLAIESK